MYHAAFLVDSYAACIGIYKEMAIGVSHSPMPPLPAASAFIINIPQR